jgi:predicted HAD superfamily Cof-like phosphohydrolase
MKKLDALNQVALFHRTFQHPVEDQPLIPAADRCRLRIALLEEELKELKQAIADGDLVEVADALCDLQYVLSGAVLEFGLGDQFVDLFEEVQRSNMSKTCATLAEAEATQRYYKEKRGFDSYIKKSGEVYLVFREGDHKTLKSVNYSPAQLADLLNKS